MIVSLAGAPVEAPATKRWARQDLNLRPLACEASALPLSHAPGNPRVAPKEWATARARVAPPPSPDLAARTPFHRIKEQTVSHPARPVRKASPRRETDCERANGRSEAPRATRDCAGRRGMLP